MSEINLSTVIRYTEAMISKAESYFQGIKSLPQIAKTDEDCNRLFGASDSELSDILNNLSKLFNSNKIYNFGVYVNGDYSESSNLRRICCNCPGNPNPYYVKNELRVKAKGILKTWQAKAEDWIKEGAKLIESGYTQIKINNSKKGGISKKSIYYE